MHIEQVSYSATAPGASGAAAAAVTGDSLIVKANEGTKRPSIIAVWGSQQASGFQQIVFQRGHDTTRNYRWGVAAALSELNIPEGIAMRPNQQEQLLPTIAGSAVAGDVEIGSMLIHYPNLPGVNMKGITFGDLQRRYKMPTSINATLSGTAAGYTGEESIIAESDQFHADSDYAIVGVTVNTPCAGVWIRGTDFGNCRIGAPADPTANPEKSRNYFSSLSRALGEPIIPIFNSANKNSITHGILQNENNVNVLVTWHLVLLND